MIIYSIVHIKVAARVLVHLKTSDCQLYLLNTPYIILFYESCSPQAKDFSWITIFPSFLSKTFVFVTHFCKNFHPPAPPTWVWTPVGGVLTVPPPTHPRWIHPWFKLGTLQNQDAKVILYLKDESRNDNIIFWFILEADWSFVFNHQLTNYGI